MLTKINIWMPEVLKRTEKDGLAHKNKNNLRKSSPEETTFPRKKEKHVSHAASHRLKSHQLVIYSCCQFGTEAKDVGRRSCKPTRALAKRW